MKNTNGVSENLRAKVKDRLQQLELTKKPKKKSKTHHGIALILIVWKLIFILMFWALIAVMPIIFVGGICIYVGILLSR